MGRAALHSQTAPARMSAWYNENDPFCAQWLRNLMARGLIPQGHVDDRSIVDVEPADLAGFSECHFFAGLGGFARALELARWPAGREVWTGSCPCQPLSVAGRRLGHADQRHLWPAFFRLIAERKPAVVLGEQVASKDGREWLAAVRTDLEQLGYAVGAADLPAAGVGAPHRRQRLWFVADADRGRRQGLGVEEHGELQGASGDLADRRGAPGRWDGEAVANAARGARRERREGIHRSDQGAAPAGSGASVEPLGAGSAADAGEPRLQISEQEILPGARRRHEGRAVAECDWWRVESDVGRVAHGIPGRVGRLRAYGNAIVPQCAAEFIKAFMEC
jgi:DNA (cytosine-5)-methyltransferase 1